VTVVTSCHGILFLLFLKKEKKRKEKPKIEKVQVKNKKTLHEKLEWRKDKFTILASDTSNVNSSCLVCYPTYNVGLLLIRQLSW